MAKTPPKVALVQPVLFDNVFDKSVKMEFTERRQSNDAGLVPLAVFDRKIGLSKAIADAFRDPRCPGKIDHTFLHLFRQRLYALLAGYPDANDAARLRNDPTFRLLLDQSLTDEDVLAAQATLSRFENQIGKTSLLKAGHALADLVIARQRRKHKHARRITIDVDPTDDPTHGQQLFSFFNAYYDHWCYLPLVVSITVHDSHNREEPDQHVVAMLLRRGNAPATEGLNFVLRRLVGKLRNAFPKAILRTRLDGGFATPETLALLNDLKLEFAFNMAKNNILKRLAEPLLKIARKEARRTGKTAKVYGEALYAAGTWKNNQNQPWKQRIIIKAEVTVDPRHPQQEPKDNPRFVVTNLTTRPQHVYETVYCRRANVENRIGELKNDLFSGRTSCSKFLPNQFRVLLSAVALALIQELREAVAATEAGSWRVGSWRERLIKFGAVVVESTRRILFRLVPQGPYVELFSQIGRQVARAAPQ